MSASLTESLLLPEPHPPVVKSSYARVAEHLDAMQAAAIAGSSPPLAFPSLLEQLPLPDCPPPLSPASDDSVPPPPYQSPTYLSPAFLASPSTAPLPHSSSSPLSTHRKGSSPSSSSSPSPPTHSRHASSSTSASCPSSSTPFTGFHRKHTPITLQFTDVSLTLPSKQPILSHVTGSFPHSRLIAIMGPSGAGQLHLHTHRASTGSVPPC